MSNSEIFRLFLCGLAGISVIYKAGISMINFSCHSAFLPIFFYSASDDDRFWLLTYESDMSAFTIWSNIQRSVRTKYAIKEKHSFEL